MSDLLPIDAELLVVVEVDKAARVQCQAPKCGHAVYKRIHVVRHAGTVGVYGSDCYERHFLRLLGDSRPRFGTTEGRLLTDEERTMLLENAERLLARFQEEHAAAQEREKQRIAQRQLLEQAAADRLEAARRQADLKRAPTDAELASVAQEAKGIVQSKFGVDPDLPGWRGLVLVEARKLLGR